MRVPTRGGGLREPTDAELAAEIRQLKRVLAELLEEQARREIRAAVRGDK